MATIQHDPQTATIRLVHFTPRAQACWCWGFFRPVVTLTGVQRTIDGMLVDIGQGSTLSEHVPGTPEFATAEEAEQWAEANGLAYMT